MHRAVLYLGVGLALVGVYLAIVFAARQVTTRQAQREAERKMAKRHAPLPAPGLKITHFYANKNEGGALICYGVLDARKVRIEPPVEELWPALNRCFSTTVAETTTFKLIAEGADGGEATASLTVSRE